MSREIQAGDRIICHDEKEALRIKASLYGSNHIESDLILDEVLNKWTLIIRGEYGKNGRD